MREFVGNLPRGEEDYYEAIGDLALSLYVKACRGRPKYFVDKTPRYYLIIPEIAKIFPRAKFIFLFRHPLAVYSSILQTYCTNRLRHLHRFAQDLFEGPLLLSRGLTQLKGENALVVNYERLVADPGSVMEGICSFLGLNYEETALKAFAKQDLRGEMGDKSGSRSYSSICADGVERWRETFNTEYRVRHARRYLSALGEETLSVQGYPLHNVLAELEGAERSSRRGIRDRIDYLMSNAYRLLDGPYFSRLIRDFGRQEKGARYRIHR